VQCDTYQLWLSAYLDGELSSSDRMALERHLDTCATCAGEMETLRGSVRLLRELTPEDPPAELRPRIMAAIAASRASTWSRLAALLRLPAPAPARSLAGTGLAVALAIGAYALWPSHEAPSRTPAPQPPAVAQRVSQPGAVAAKPGSEPRSGHRAGAGGDRSARPLGARVARASATSPAGPTEAVHPAMTLSSPGVRRPKHEDAPRSSRVAMLPPRRPHHEEREESRAKAAAARRTAPSGPGPTSASGFDGFESPAPRVSANPAASGAIDAAPEEPMTMMASMPMVSSGVGETASAAGDALASLRERLAEQRREVPIPAVDPPVSRRDARSLPVRIEF
jgi:hypothetical protein